MIMFWFLCEAENVSFLIISVREDDWLVIVKGWDMLRPDIRWALINQLFFNRPLIGPYYRSGSRGEAKVLGGQAGGSHQAPPLPHQLLPVQVSYFCIFHTVSVMTPGYMQWRRCTSWRNICPPSIFQQQSTPQYHNTKGMCSPGAGTNDQGEGGGTEWEQGHEPGEAAAWQGPAWAGGGRHAVRAARQEELCHLPHEAGLIIINVEW